MIFYYKFIKLIKLWNIVVGYANHTNIINIHPSDHLTIIIIIVQYHLLFYNQQITQKRLSQKNFIQYKYQSFNTKRSSITDIFYLNNSSWLTSPIVSSLKQTVSLKLQISQILSSPIIILLVKLYSCIITNDHKQES